MSICLYGRKKVIDTRQPIYCIFSFGKEYDVKYTLIFFCENRFSYTKWEFKNISINFNLCIFKY